jgi:hypothetical protein
MSSMPPVYIVSAARTPTGMFLGYVILLQRGVALQQLTVIQLPLESDSHSARFSCYQGYVEAVHEVQKTAGLT